MLNVNDAGYITKSVSQRKKCKANTTSEYEVTFVQYGTTICHEVYAKNSGEAQKKVRSKFGNINLISCECVSDV